MSDEEAVIVRPDISDVRAHDPQWRTFNKYKMKRFAGKKVTLPTGINLESSRWANVKPPLTNDTLVLHSPELILKNPRPNCKYIWRIRNDEETIGLVETNEIRPVAMDELIRDKKTAKIIGWVGPAGIKYAGWKRHGLFEVNPQTSYDWFGYPEDLAISKLMAVGPTFEANVEEESKGKMVGEFSTRDNKKASQEPRGRG
jgi:hypothetical protein